MATYIFEHSDESGSGRVGETLRDNGHRLCVLRLHAGDAVPADLDGIDAIVTCGGSQKPDDDGAHAWIQDELRLLRAAHEAALPVLGICLGNQLLARALGGTVAPLDDGEFGWHEVALTPAGREDPLFAGIPWWSTQVHWHRHYVVDVPPGARVLATSERCPVQAWSLGLRTYGVQYHPEADRPTIEQWARSEPDALGITADAFRAQNDDEYPVFARLGQRFADRVALVHMPVERRYTGLVKDLHH